MDDYYIYADEVPRDAKFIPIGPDNSVIVKRHTKYDIIRDRKTRQDIGIAIYSGSTPLGYRSHNRLVAWIFFNTGCLCSPVARAFFKVPNGEKVILSRDLIQELDTVKAKEELEVMV